jgi:hypothetical protein
VHAEPSIHQLVRESGAGLRFTSYRADSGSLLNGVAP